jgi:hypothetical protein
MVLDESNTGLVRCGIIWGAGGQFAVRYQGAMTGMMIRLRDTFWE